MPSDVLTGNLHGTTRAKIGGLRRSSRGAISASPLGTTVSGSGYRAALQDLFQVGALDEAHRDIESSRSASPAS
jgi:hypothetical protein